MERSHLFRVSCGNGHFGNDRQVQSSSIIKCLQGSSGQRPHQQRKFRKNLRTSGGRVGWLNILILHSLIIKRSFDLDLPIECDDEYWETDNPEDAFKQPPGHPSYVSYFVWLIQITRILSSALRKIVRFFV